VGVYNDQVVPRLVEWCCGSSGLDEWRARATEGLSGRVVEIGFGSGLNVPLYPPGVDTVLAVEPSPVARQRAARRVRAATVPVEHVGLDGQSLPLDDASCDAALCTFTLCTVPDPAQALAELLRVLKPTGTLHFLEHGLSPDAGVAKWQHRIDPVQRRLADGCHLTRDPSALVEQGGFQMQQNDQRYVKGPKPWSWLTLGVAAKPTGAA
jgi:ubiquinone/menaquinone biosynthesis C-methylase UbiE